MRQGDDFRQATSTGGDKPQLVADLPEAGKGRARDIAARALHVAGRTIQKAVAVEKTVPELFEKIDHGEITVGKKYLAWDAPGRVGEA